MKRRILFLAVLWAVTVALMALQKPLFMAFHWAQSVAAGGPEVWWAVLLHGLKLDATVAGYVTALPLLVVLASVWVRLPAVVWRRIIMVWLTIVSLATSLVVAVDAGLYGHWGFRIDSSVLAYLSDPKSAVASITLSEWVVQSILFVLSSAWMIVVYRMVLRLLRTDPVRLRLLHTGTMLLLAGLCFLAIRGGVSVAVANVSKVYFSDRLFLNHAAVNPLFSFLSSLGKSEDYGSFYRFFDEPQRAGLFGELSGEPRPQSDSLPRVLATRRPDVAIVILESFARTIMEETIDGRPVMPQMRRLREEGVWFENFFANSFRTDRGEVALLNGFPAQTNMSIMKLPAKSQSLPSIARTLAGEGYRTSFLYGGDLNFTDQASYMYGTGWQQLTWQKDLRFDAPTSKWGYADDVVTEYFADRIIELSRSDQPFLAGMLTLSSHEPFDVPADEFDDPMLNAAWFADSCVGRMVERLRASPAWDNLLLVLVADHAYGYPYGIAYNTGLRHRIPMLWLGGAVEGPLRVEEYGSQIDLAATLLARMGIDHGDFIFSKDLFDQAQPKFGYWCFNEGFGMADERGETIYDCTSGRTVFDSLPDPRRELWGKALLQTTYKEIGER